MTTKHPTTLVMTDQGGVGPEHEELINYYKPEGVDIGQIYKEREREKEKKEREG